ncbi:IQ motif-containing protein H [Cololabis saira]|uniref:IQ motif-containing protein H n=1 Tax=Cololabis saira TaxID=129043 RepID=UPI002AD45F9A|nr:IQ motif-containing protein H [Cololabis saira]
MSDPDKNEDKAGAVLAQVHNDLRQLRSSLERIPVSERGTMLDFEALDNAICRIESSIRKRAEDYLKIEYKQHLVLPNIEDLQKETVKMSNWEPSLKSIPDVYRQKEGLPEASPGEKVKHPRKLVGSVSLASAAKPKGHSLLSVPDDDTGTATQSNMVCMAVQQKSVSLQLGEDSHPYKPGLNSRYHKHPKWQSDSQSTCLRNVDECRLLGISKALLHCKASKHMDQRSKVKDTSSVIPECPQNTLKEVPVNITKYPFTVIKGHIDPVATDFCHFKQSFSLCWSRVVHILRALKELLRDYSVPLAKVSGERLVELSHCWDNGWRRAPSVNTLLSVLENQEEVLSLISRPGQRYKGEGGVEAAAIRVQSCWRRYLAKVLNLSLRRRKWAVGVISISWLMHNQTHRVRSALKARRLSQLENNRSRTQHLAANWKHIQSSKRTIIHIPSLGYSQSQQLNVRTYDILQNLQIGRLCDVRDKNVDVIFICPTRLGDDIVQYYTRLLKCGEATYGAGTSTSQAPPCKRRFIVLTPEAVDYFPTHNMCLSTLLKYSPCTLKRIKNLILGKQAYIVGRVAHADDLAVANELGVPILGPEPAVSQLYSSNSEKRRIFAGAKVDVPPGQGDVYSLNQLHETLVKLLTENITVKRWLFKTNSDHGGRGTAYCDVCHLSCFNWALQQYHRYSPDLWASEWIQESVQLRFLNVLPEWLARYAQPAKTSCYPTWACFLKSFLRQGGVLEAAPPSESVTYLTVDLLLEPGGEVTMVSCGDQLHGSCHLEPAGSTVPQTSVHAEQLHSICMRVGQACLQRLIVGYVSVGLATFLDHSTLEQKVWAINLDIAYSDQLTMTQILLMMTGGTLNWQTGCLELPIPIRERRQGRAKHSVVNCYAVIGSHLFHTNLSMFYHNVFIKKCEDHGIAFNVKRKQGTVFAFYDSSERCSIGMMTVSEDLQQALVTFAQNLSVIHQEISSPKIQGETNFKELIKNIEEVLQMTFQNKRQLKDKPTA